MILEMFYIKKPIWAAVIEALTENKLVWHWSKKCA